VKKRKQHYVWSYYLKPWARNGKIWCLRRGKIFNPSLKRIANRRDFYRLEPLSDEEIMAVRAFAEAPLSDHLKAVNKGWMEMFAIPFKLERLVGDNNDPRVIALQDETRNNFEEDFHADIESRSVKHLELLRKGDVSFFKDDKECHDFLHFVCLQSMRTAKLEHIAVTAAEPLFEGLRFPRMWKIIRHMLATNMAWVFYAERRSWHLVILESVGDAFFLTGDQPVVSYASNPSQVREGAEDFDFNLYYPITPRLALLITQEVPPEGNRLAIDPSMVSHFNELIVRNAHEQVFGLSSEALKQLAAG
jgi:hypothetical protein